MRCMILAFAFAVASVASAQDISARRVVIHQHNYISAQAHADQLAATGGFGHCSRRGGRVEGIGMSPRSPLDACKRACFWNQRPVVEIGTAWCPVRRVWLAVVRYW